MKKQSTATIQQQLKTSMDLELLETIHPLIHNKDIKDAVNELINKLKQKA